MSKPIWDNSGFKRFSRNLERLGSKETVSLGELFPAAFVAKHTRFAAIQALFDASGYRFESPHDLAAIPDAEWDAFIAGNTQFATWSEMQEAAHKEWMASQLNRR